MWGKSGNGPIECSTLVNTPSLTYPSIFSYQIKMQAGTVGMEYSTEATCDLHDATFINLASADTHTYA